MLIKDYWINFANVWNNHEKYKTVAEVGIALDTTASGASTKARKYKQYLKSKPELQLPPLLDRKKITNDGWVYIEHEIEINASQNIDETKSRYVISCAQYGADVNIEYLESLKNYCNKNDAQLIIMPIRYGASIDPMSPLLNDFMTYSGHFLGEHLELNTASIIPTAVNPLTGLHKFSRHRSQIFAHPQVAMETVGRSDIKLPKVMMTTGAVTYPLYGFNRTSEIAELMHSFGAVVVEVKDGMFHYRQLIADSDNSFCDFAGGEVLKYTPEGIVSGSVDSLVCGDWHTGETCHKVGTATYMDIVPMLKPKNIVKHDFFNGHSVSHHDERNDIIMINKAENGMDCLKTELDMCSFELSQIKYKSNGAKVYIVASNHNDHLDQYISEKRYDKDYKNKMEALKLMMAKVKTGKGAFELAMLERGHNDVVFLKRDENFTRHGVKLDMHGDVGINGAKGSAASFNRIGLKSVIGHVHSPSIKGDCFAVGTSTPLRLGYTRGLTGWLNTHCIVYDNGQRQMINIIDGVWHG